MGNKQPQVDNKTLRHMLEVERAKRRTVKVSHNCGEPWDSLSKFWDENLVELMEELLDRRSHNP